MVAAHEITFKYNDYSTLLTFDRTERQLNEIKQCNSQQQTVSASDVVYEQFTPYRRHSQQVATSHCPLRRASLSDVAPLRASS
jgi:hypothetical protein